MAAQKPKTKKFFLQRSNKKSENKDYKPQPQT